MAKKSFAVPIIAMLSVLGMSGCSELTSAIAPSIGENGNWVVAGTDTGIAAQGPKGEDGVAPTISINEDGYWVINGTATNIYAQGKDGKDGNPGETPTVSINDDGFWFINGVVTSISAQGKDGKDGNPGETPSISINDDGYWVINGTVTNVSAKGSDGAPGAPGQTPTIEIGIDNCWWINGVSTGVSAVGSDGAPGTPGAQGDPGENGAEGKSAFEIFMEYYPHYSGTEADWIKGVADGTLAANMPKAGHNGDWTYNSETGKIERICSECGAYESKDASLPGFVSFEIGETSVDGFYEIINDATYPWTYDAATGTWKSGNKGVHSSSSTLKIKSLIAGATVSFHVHASGEGSSTLYDYFSTSTTIGASCNINGTRIGTPSGQDRDGEFTFDEANSEGSLSFTKDSSGQAGEDEATVTELKMNVPLDAIDNDHMPSVVVVNFDSCNGDADTQQTIWSGTGVTLPTPTRAGYIFDGWFSDAACTVPAPATFDASCTLYAKWVVAHKVTIVDMSPGADDLIISVAHNGTLDIETPVDDEKLFGGFFVAPSCAAGFEFDITTPIKRDTIIYCKWTDAPAYCGSYGGSNIYGYNFGENRSASLTISPSGVMSGTYSGTVSGIDDDGCLIVTGTNDKLYVIDDMIIGVSAMGLDDDFYVFVKGKQPSSSENKFIFNTAISNTGAVANNKGRIFSVDRDGVVTNYCIFGDTFYKNVSVSSLDNDFVIGTAADTYGKDICVKDEFGNVITTQIKRLSVADDYGVYTDSESHVLKVYGDNSTISLDGELITATKDSSGVYSFVEYSERKTVTSYRASSSWYNMNYDADKGCWVHDDYSGSSHVYTDTPYTDPDIVWRRENNVFVFGEDKVAGNAFVTLVGDSFEVSRPTFTVTAHIGDVATSTTLRVGNAVVLPTPEVPANQQFEGWFTNPQFDGEPVTQMTTDGDVYAKIVNIYKLIVHKNLTEQDTTETIIFHANEIMTPPEVTLEGAEFLGWFTDPSCETPYVAEANVESVEIYAKWLKGKYANSAANWFDSFDPNEEFIDEITWEGGVYAWKMDTLEIDGVTYTGMKSGNYHSTTASTISVKFKADAVVSFDWFTAGESGYDYLRIYKNGNLIIDGKGKASSSYGNPDATPYHAPATVIIAAGDTLKFAFTQDSTYYEPDCGFIYNLSIAAPASANLTLNPNYDGGTPVVQQVGVGYVIDPADPAARDGFAFDGWYLEATCDTPFDPSTVMTSEGLTLYAKWVAAVNLTVHADNETVVMALKPNTAPDMSSFNKDGYIIQGYFAESTFENPVDISNGISADTEVYIKYLDATVFVGKYVGYNMMTSTLGKVKTGSDITNSSYRASFNESLVGEDSKASGKTITGYSDGVLTTTGGKMLCAIAQDGTVFLCNHYQGFRDTVSISGKDLMFAVNTGASYDGSVTIVNNQGDSNNWIVTVTKGGKVYTVNLDFAANTMSIVSVADAE